MAGRKSSDSGVKARTPTAKERRGKAAASGSLEDSPLLEPIVSAMIRGTPLASVRRRIVDAGQASAEEFARLEEIARGLIVRAASFDSVEEYGKARKSFEDLYSQALQQGNLKLALDARKELVKLYRLETAPNTQAVEEAYQSATEEMVRGHLEPVAVELGIAPEGTAIVELARRVVLWLVSNIDAPAKVRKARKARNVG